MAGWSVFAVTDVKKGALALRGLANASLSNLVVSTEGQLLMSEAIGPYTGVGIGYDDKSYHDADFFYTRDIVKYNSGSEKSVEISSQIEAFQQMIAKVKTGGNAIIAACQVGYSY